MPAFIADDKALERLEIALKAIVEILERWGAAEAIGEAPAGLPEYDLDDVAAAFEKILTELKESGPDGHEVYQHFGAIAHELRAAASALTGK